MVILNYRYLTVSTCIFLPQMPNINKFNDDRQTITFSYFVA